MATEGREVSAVGQELSAIPIDFVTKHSATATQLNLSYNGLQHLDGLQAFEKLEQLTLDSCELTEAVKFPRLPRLHTLSLQKNPFSNLRELVPGLAVSFPGLSYLSLLGCNCAPSLLTGSSATEEKRYRRFILACFPNLKFLDISPVTLAERLDADAHAISLGSVISAQPQHEEVEEAPKRPGEGSFTPPEEEVGQRAGKFTAHTGRARYMYSGRRSEGNRYIKNEQL